MSKNRLSSHYQNSEGHRCSDVLLVL